MKIEEFAVEAIKSNLSNDFPPLDKSENPPKTDI
jgi:hypothetical protein